MNLRQITIKDQLELKKVYFDSIQSLDEKIYSQEQKTAWSSQAWKNPNFAEISIQTISGRSLGRYSKVHNFHFFQSFTMIFVYSRVSYMTYVRLQILCKVPLISY